MTVMICSIPFSTSILHRSVVFKGSDLLLWYWQTDVWYTFLNLPSPFSNFKKRSSKICVYSYLLYCWDRWSFISPHRIKRLALSLFHNMASGTVSFIASIKRCRENQMKVSLLDGMIWVVYLEFTSSWIWGFWWWAVLMNCFSNSALALWFLVSW